LEGGVTGPQATCSTPGGVQTTRGVGEQVCSGGTLLRRIIDLSERWETGGDRAKVEGSQGCSNLVPT